MICAARAMAQALQVSVAGQTSNDLRLDNTVGALTASIQKSRIDIGNGDGIRVQNAQGFGWWVGWQPMVWTPRASGGGSSGGSVGEPRLSIRWRSAACVATT